MYWCLYSSQRSAQYCGCVVLSVLNPKDPQPSQNIRSGSTFIAFNPVTMLYMEFPSGVAEVAFICAS
jgi:hypothetical protein